MACCSALLDCEMEVQMYRFNLVLFEWCLVQGCSVDGWE